MKRFFVVAVLLALTYAVVDWVLDRWVIKSDDADPQGIIVQAAGFGLDDVVRMGAIGLTGAAVVRGLSKRKAA